LGLGILLLYGAFKGTAKLDVLDYLDGKKIQSLQKYEDEVDLLFMSRVTIKAHRYL
jgi:hypothetical protein